MRFVFAIAVGIVLAACALEQSGSQRTFIDGGSHAAQAAKDVDAIMLGMARAQLANERMARDTNAAVPGTPAVTR